MHGRDEPTHERKGQGVRRDTCVGPPACNAENDGERKHEYALVPTQIARCLCQNFTDE